jgi:hypothetical protein
MQRILYDSPKDMDTKLFIKLFENDKLLTLEEVDEIYSYEVGRAEYSRIKDNISFVKYKFQVEDRWFEITFTEDTNKNLVLSTDGIIRECATIR